MYACVTSIEWGIPESRDLVIQLVAAQLKRYKPLALTLHPVIRNSYSRSAVFYQRLQNSTIKICGPGCGRYGPKAGITVHPGYSAVVLLSLEVCRLPECAPDPKTPIG